MRTSPLQRAFFAVTMMFGGALVVSEADMQEAKADIIELTIESDTGANGSLGSGFPGVSNGDPLSLKIVYDSSLAQDSNSDPLDSNFNNDFILSYTLIVGDPLAPIISSSANFMDNGNLGNFSIDQDTNLDTFRGTINDFNPNDDLTFTEWTIQTPAAFFATDGIEEIENLTGGVGQTASVRNIFLRTNGGAARFRATNIEANQYTAVPQPSSTAVLLLGALGFAAQRRRFSVDGTKPSDYEFTNE